MLDRKRYRVAFVAAGCLAVAMGEVSLVVGTARDHGGRAGRPEAMGGVRVYSTRCMSPEMRASVPVPGEVDHEEDAMMPDEIRFYRANEKPYGTFSNLYRRPMAFDGATFETAEHAYQHGKAREDKVRAWLMAAPSPSLLAMAAHGLLSWDIAPGWSKGRYARMRRVVEAKFRQHPDLAAILIGTGDARIVESASVDNEVNRRWGEVKGVGKNWLGLILMEVRSVLAAEVPGEVVTEDGRVVAEVPMATGGPR